MSVVGILFLWTTSAALRSETSYVLCDQSMLATK
jgi:hypothetical protein